MAATTTQSSNASPISLPNMSVPPPATPNLSAPPPNLTTINTSGAYQHRSYSNHRDGNRGFFKPFRPYHAPKIISGGPESLQDEFDGKRLRKSVMRKTVDYNSAIIKSLENRVWQRDYRDRRALQPDVIYYPELLPPPSYIDNPINAVTTRFVKTATNKMRCPIFCMAWTPEGRRLVTGASSGEFTLWNGLTFNFETILQAHDSPVRTMVWSHNESWMVTGDHAGYVKYWQSNMNNVKMFQAHKEAIRGLSFSPTDHKLATCSDDGTVRIWDFLRCHEERILRGHGADVKCVHWHPQKSLVISGSKDNQQPVKLWDPKTGQSLATLHAHKSTVMDVKWNENGNWLVTASRDHLLKLFDLRNLSQEVQTFRGHKKEASSVAWHPSHEGLFCSGGSDGAILFWHVGADKEVGAIEQAHDSIVWTLAWHPLGHILCSGSNDHTSKFWTRNRPGDLMRDKYNLNTLPAGAAGIDDHEVAEEAAVIPGMGPEDRISIEAEPEEVNKPGGIPGLDLDHAVDEGRKNANKKVPYSKPIPRNFQAQWNEMEAEDSEQAEALNAFVNQLIETTPGAVPLNEVTPNAIILYGKMITVEPGSKLAQAITQGSEAINKLVLAGEIEELKDVCTNFIEELDEPEEFLQDDRELDFSHIPELELPAPLPSSKFAQNPELLKALNRGGKRKFDQLIGWTTDSGTPGNANPNERGSKMHQPVFGNLGTEDSQSSDNDLRFNKNNDLYFEDEDLRRLPSTNDIIRNINNRDDEDMRYNISGPGRPDLDSRNNYDGDFRQQGFNKNKNLENDIFSERDRQRWEEENRKMDFVNHFDKRDSSGMHLNVNSDLMMDNRLSHLRNMSNMQNINPNMPPGMIATNVPPPGMSKGNSSNMQQHNMDGQQHPMGVLHSTVTPGPAFTPNGPPPGNFPPNFRPPPPNNFMPGQHHFRPNPMAPFAPSQGGPGPLPPFRNDFPGPPPNFRGPMFDRPGFGGPPPPGPPHFRGPVPGSGLNSFSPNFGNFNPNNKNGAQGNGNNRGGMMNRGGFNNRGRGRRDNY